MGIDKQFCNSSLLHGRGMCAIGSVHYMAIATKQVRSGLTLCRPHLRG